MPGAIYLNTTLDGATTSVTGGPVPLYLDKPRTVNFTQHWNEGGGTMAGTTTVEVSSDPRVRDDINTGLAGTASETAEWDDITADLTTVDNPATGNGRGMIRGSFPGGGWIRVKCARTSGSGTYRVGLDFA